MLLDATPRPKFFLAAVPNHWLDLMAHRQDARLVKPEEKKVHERPVIHAALACQGESIYRCWTAICGRYGHSPVHVFAFYPDWPDLCYTLLVRTLLRFPHLFSAQSMYAELRLFGGATPDP